MKRYYKYIRWLDIATVFMLGLVLLLREIGMDGSNGGFDFANVAGRLFLILLFITAGIHFLDPNESIADKMHGGLFGSIVRNIFRR